MESAKRINRKGSRIIAGRASRSKKRPKPPNRHTMECETASTSASAKKLKTSDTSEVPIDVQHGYRLINFLTLFSTLSTFLKCKVCNGNITFGECDIRGLGFKLIIKCDKCTPQYIYSCPLINKAYEINRRLVFAMRVLGYGYDGIKKFCGIMDLPTIFSKKIYYEILKNIHCASQSVASILVSEAATEEKFLTARAENMSEPTGLIISGDGTWRKRGYSSNQGVVTLIGYYSGKVVDFIVKSLYCKTCEYWKQHMNPENLETWMGSHKDACAITHEGSSGKMEVDGAVEMFARSQELHGVKYLSYIGDGDSKTYKGIVDSQPYGDIAIIKKECVGHVQKRMGARLRKVRKETKELGGKGKLTFKLIDELSVYYGLAIRRNKDSIEDMKKAIWATLEHKSSTDTKPQHNNCPPGSNSWCTWQVAKANNKLSEYTHKPALPDVIIKAITPIYKDLSRDELLQRCLGGFTQNQNESLNSLIWSFAPKRLFSGAQTVEIAAYIAASIFNKGYSSILLILNTMNIIIGPNAFTTCVALDEERIVTAEKRASAASKEGRIARRSNRSAAYEDALEAEGSSYEAGMAD